MENGVSIKRVSLNELTTLQSLCKEIYPIYFGDHWEGEGLQRYLEEQYGTERLSRDLNDPTIHYFFICYQDKTVGFLKINFDSTFEAYDVKTTCELEKMYLSPEYKGKGLGKLALNMLIESIRRQRKKMLFLYVLDTNQKSMLFYESVGFKFQGKTRLDYTHFKEELKGLNRMCLILKRGT